MARVPVSERELRAAMRDDRYWRTNHPEYGDYRAWVTRGWQELAAGGALDGDGTIVVQVSGYERTRNGRRERVEPYQQTRRAARPDEANDNAPEAAGPTPLVNTSAAPEPERRVVVVFVGGGGDRWLNGPVSQFFRTTQDSPNFAGVETRHFDHDHQGRIERFIRAQPQGTSVRLIGHSWGANTAAKVAGNLGRDGLSVDMLVTVDPVGNNDAERPAAIQAARAGARRWINVRATGGSLLDPDNLVAAAGGAWGRDAQGVADEFIEAPVSHAAFGRMLGARLPNGRTLVEEATGRLDQ